MGSYWAQFLPISLSQCGLITDCRFLQRIHCSVEPSMGCGGKPASPCCSPQASGEPSPAPVAPCSPPSPTQVFTGLFVALFPYCCTLKCMFLKALPFCLRLSCVLLVQGVSVTSCWSCYTYQAQKFRCRTCCYTLSVDTFTCCDRS